MMHTAQDSFSFPEYMMVLVMTCWKFCEHFAVSVKMLLLDRNALYLPYYVAAVAFT